MATISIPTLLRNLTGGADTVGAQGATIDTVLDNLEAEFPGIRARICDDGGRVRRSINLYVNGEDIRFLQGQQTPIKGSDEITIVPAIAGG